METVKSKEKKSYAALKGKFGYKNPMSSPKLLKVSVSSGTGKAKDKKRNELVANRLMKITGQKPSPRGAKKSIASFKSREGDIIGYLVTLRGERMRSFLDKFFNIALPRTKDFKGVDKKSVDNIGNMTISVKEHTIFPETSDEELKDVFGLAVTIVTTAKTKEEAVAFFEHLGVPFRK